MILYHGTNTDFHIIDLSKSRKYKDFGQGFYLTEDEKQANRLSIQRSLVDGGSTIVLTFEFDEESASKDETLKIIRFEEYNKDWALFVNKNRNLNYSGRMHDFDIVYGPIADDTVGLQGKLFNQQLRDIDTLIDRLKFVVPTFQYYFGTDAALKYLRRV